MSFKFNKKSKYSRLEVWNEVTGRDDDRPGYNIGRSGYGRINNGNDLFIFMNVGTPGRTNQGDIDYQNHYDEKTEGARWCAQKDTHSQQPLMQKIINGDLNLYLFARWDRRPQWTFLGQAYFISYKDNVSVATPDENDATCMEYVLNCRDIEEDINQEEIKAGVLNLKSDKPRKKSRIKRKRTFNSGKNINYGLKAKTDKKIGEWGEALVVDWEKERLLKEGHEELSNKVEHISKTKGDGAGYDVLSYNSDGTDRYIEVKATKSNINTDFFMTPNELEFSKLHHNNYFLYRVYNLEVKPLVADFFTVKGDISDKYESEPTEFRMYPKLIE